MAEEKTSNQAATDVRSKRSVAGVVIMFVVLWFLFSLANRSGSEMSQSEALLSILPAAASPPNVANEATATQASLEPPVYKVAPCHAADLEMLQDRFDPSENTHCPRADWLREYYLAMWEGALAQKEPSPPRSSFVGVNVGCNKGTDAVDLARLGSADARYDGATTWKKAIEAQVRTRLRPKCGWDPPLQVPEMTPEQYAAIKPSVVEVHCIEPIQRTYEPMNRVGEQLGWKREQGGGLVFTNAAMSFESGSQLFPKGKEFGDEGSSLSSCERNDDHSFGGCVEIPIYSLDDYVDQRVEPDVPIDVLLIDAEGFDFDILLGSQRSALPRARYVAFENHEYESWGKTRLSNAIELMRHYDFICYWAGQGELYRITDCWLDKYDNQGWSNVACVKSTQVAMVQLMEENFFRSLKNLAGRPKLEEDQPEGGEE